MTRAELDKLADHPLVGVFPRLTRFYGLSFAELAQMPRWALQLYADGLVGLQAEEQGLAIEASAFPHLEERDRRAVLKKLRKAAPSMDADPETVDAASAGGQNDLASIGIRVVVEDA